jgi:hypothetical protein
MFQEVFVFSWRAPQSGGFTWAKCRSRYLMLPETDGLVPLEGTTYLTYRPLDIGIALHRELAASGPTPEGWLVFANKYGMLGRSSNSWEVLPAPGISTSPPFPVETQHDWQVVVLWLREAVRIWDMVQEDDTGGLAEVIRWEKDGVARYRPPPSVLEEFDKEDMDWPEHPNIKGYDIIGSAPGAADLRRHIPRGDLIRPATLFVHQLIHAHLWMEVGPRLVWDGKRNRTVRQDTPRSLLGAICLSFAQEVMSLRKPGKCRVCGRWFELSPVPGRSYRQTRSDRATCSTACRSKAYRERQESARQMFASRKSVKEIAKTLDCLPATVKGWVKNVRQEE